MAKQVAKTNVMRVLDKEGIAYQVHSYNAADGQIDGVSVAHKIGCQPGQVFKTLVTVGASHELYVFVVPVAHELDLKKAATAAGEKSMAMCPGKDLLKNTGYIHGGCSPIGMKKLFATFIEQSAKTQPTIVFSAGKIGVQVELPPDTLCALTKAKYEDIIKD